jgi:hypothetical protein
MVCVESDDAKECNDVRNGRAKRTRGPLGVWDVADSALTHVLLNLFLVRLRVRHVSSGSAALHPRLSQTAAPQLNADASGCGFGVEALL